MGAEDTGRASGPASGSGSPHKGPRSAGTSPSASTAAVESARGALRGPRSLVPRGLLVYLGLAASLALNAACLEHILGGVKVLPLLGFWRPSDTKSVPSSAAPVEVEGSSEGQSGAHNSAEEAAPGDPFAFPGVGQCGLWAPNYTRVHTDILTGAKPQKFITLLPSGPGGDLGGSLMGVVSMFLAALLTNRALIIADPNILDAFDPAGVDWRAGAVVPMTATAGERGKVPEAAAVTEGSVLFFDLRNEELQAGAPSKAGLVRFPEHILDFFGPFQKASNLLVEADGGVVSKIFGFNSRTFRALFYTWGFRLPTATGCILRFLLRPKPEVLRLVDKPLAALRQPSTRAVCVGLHGAAGIPAPRLAVALNATLGCAGNIEEYWFPPAWKVYWLLATDSEALAALASTLVPAEKLMVLSSGTRAEGAAGEGPEGVKERAAEWLLFAQCQYYAFADSSFCKSSFGFNIGAPLVFLYPPLAEDPRATCEASHGHSLLSLVQWHSL